MRKKTNDEFVEEVYDLVGDEYKVLSEYQGSKSKVRFYHNVCKNDFLMSPNSFLRGQRCPNCSGVMKKTTEQFKEEISQLYGDEYTVLGEYKNNKTKIKIKHNVCNNVYEVTPNSILRGTKCSYCYLTRKKTNEQFLKEVYDLVADEYIFLDEYVNSRTKLKVKHNKCNNIYEVTPHDFLGGQRCPKCTELVRIKKETKTTQQFKDEVYYLVGDEYEVLSEYKNNYTKILMKHTKCGNTYYTKPSYFLSGTRCPKCYQSGISHGNEYIAKYLDEHGIKYSREYRFDGCVYKASLPFDFYLPTLNICIEYDGEQHYVRNDFFEEHDPFKERQAKDKIKSKYCYQHNIKLIRIKYTQFNKIEDILNKELTN